MRTKFQQQMINNTRQDLYLMRHRPEFYFGFGFWILVTLFSGLALMYVWFSAGMDYTMPGALAIAILCICSALWSRKAKKLYKARHLEPCVVYQVI